MNFAARHLGPYSPKSIRRVGHDQALFDQHTDDKSVLDVLLAVQRTAKHLPDDYYDDDDYYYDLDDVVESDDGDELRRKGAGPPSRRWAASSTRSRPSGGAASRKSLAVPALDAPRLTSRGRPPVEPFNRRQNLIFFPSKFRLIL